MRIDAIAQHRRRQGAFARALEGRQPTQGHGRTQRFGCAPRPLSVRNAAEALTVGLLCSALLPPGRAATPSGYVTVDVGEPLAQAANAAAAGCLAHPRQCPQILAGTLLGGLGGLVGGAWLGSRAPRAPAACLPGEREDTGEAPRSAALSSTATTGFAAADLDTSQDPCRSLYGYVNGRWANTTRLTGTLSRWHVVGMLREQSLLQQRALAEQLSGQASTTPAQRVVADLWSSGMDAVHINGDALRPLREELAAIDALDNTGAIAAHLRMLTAEGRNPVFSFTVEPDMDNRTTLMAYAHQGGLGLADPNDYFDVRRDAVRQAYRAHIARLLRLSGVADDQAQRDATAVFALEQRLAAASVNRQALRSDIRLFYNPTSPADADALTPHFNWSALFQTLGVMPPARFSLAMPAFHQAVNAALADAAPAAWRAYLRFHCLDMASPYLDDSFANAAHAFQQEQVSIQQPLPPRWKRVLAAVDAFAGEAMSEVYASAHFPAQTRTRLEQMVQQMRIVLKRRLGTLPWMDEATRVTAQAKAEQLDPRIGHPEQWPSWSGLRTERCGYLGNLQRARAFQTRTRIDRIGHSTDIGHVPLLAHDVNAYFDVMQNDMAFSAALLQPPYFDPQADDALNYGAAGATIGHEMAHAFSAETSQFAPDGQLRLWWSQQDLNRYADIVQRLTRQFDRETVDGLPINGTLTANENMADLGGLVLALDALHEQAGAQPDPMIDGLSREQRFFISWALINRRQQTRQRLRLELQLDPHALAAPRADVAPSNMAAFAEAFQCAAGTPMVRGEHERVVYL